MLMVPIDVSSPSPKIFAVETRVVDTSHKRSIDQGHVRPTPSTFSLLRGSHPGTTPWITHALAHADGVRPWLRHCGGNGRHRLMGKQTAGSATRLPSMRSYPHDASVATSAAPVPPFSTRTPLSCPALPPRPSFQLALRLRCYPALSPLPPILPVPARAVLLVLCVCCAPAAAAREVIPSERQCVWIVLVSLLGVV